MQIWTFLAATVSMMQNGHAHLPKKRMAVNSGKQIKRIGEPHC